WGGGGYRPSAVGPFSQFSLPVIVGDQLFVQNASSVQCVGAADGKRLWTAKEPFEMNLTRSGGGRFAPYYYAGQRSRQGVPVAGRGRIYVRMPVGNTEGYSASRWPADFALAALDAHSGTPIWLRFAGASEARGQRSAAVGTYYNLPSLQSNTLYTGIATP